MHLKKLKEFSHISKSPKNLEFSLQILEQRLPESAMFYNMIKLLTNGLFDNRPEINFDIYIYSQDNQHENIFIFMLMKSRCPLIIVQTSQPAKVTPEMISAFERAINWQKSYEFNVSGQDFCTIMQNLIGKLKTEIKSHDVASTSAYILPQEDALNYQLAELENSEVTVRSLKSNDAHTMMKYWYTEGPPKRIGFVQEAIDTVIGLEVYAPDYHEPVTCIVGSTIGTINCLYTLIEFRGHGYAQTVIKVMSKHLVQLGLIPSAHICDENEGSRFLFQKMGFQFSNKNFRIRTYGH